MKRILPAVFVVLALLAGSAAVYYMQKPGRGTAEAMAAVAYLPADTLLLVAIPEPAQTCADWKTTDLYKIWLEPDIQAFLAKPLSLIPPDKNRDEVIAQIAKLEPRNIFAALTSLDEKTSQPHMLAGFQFKGSSSDVDHLLAPARNALLQYPAAKADLINYQNHPVSTIDNGAGVTIASVYLGDWYLLANDIALLKATIDRVDHRAPAADAPTLDKDADFQAVSAKLPGGYESLLYARPQPFLSRIFALAAAGGQPVSAEARAEAEKARAIGVTTKIDDGKLRDTIYYLAPGLRQDLAHLSLNSLALSSADTLLYFAQTYRLPAKMELPADPGAGAAAAGMPNPFALLNAVGQQLAAKGITLDAARAAFGSEVSFQLDWAASRSQPTALLSIDVKDPAAAGKIVDGLSGAAMGEATWEVKQAGALTLHVLTIPNLDAIKPTLAVTAKSAILGFTAASVKDAAARELGTEPNFTQAESYKTAVTEVSKPNVGFAYLDSKALFQRIYDVAKPTLILGAALLYPQVNDYVDLSKLPAAEAVTRHLSPTVMSSTLDAQGSLVESIGSVTIFQAGATLASGAAAAAVPFMQSKFSGLLPLGGLGGMGRKAAPAATPPGPSPNASPVAQPGANH